MPGIVETQEVRLSSRVGGRVEKVLVRESDMVAADQPIVELEMPELDAQREQLVAQKDAAEAVVERLVNGPRPEEKEAAKAAVDAAAARLARMQFGYRKEEIEQARQEQVVRGILYSMMSSARASRVGEMLRPRALAVLRLIASSNLVGCWTGRSPGLAPFKILSTYVAARR